MATVKQLPTPVNVEVVAGDPFTVTFTATSGVTTFASPAVTVTTAAGDSYTTDPGVPTASAASAVLTLAWSAADTAALNTGTRAKAYKYSVEATADDEGAFQIFGGTLTVHPVGTTGTGTSSSQSATLTLGGAAVTATVALGGVGFDITGSNVRLGATAGEDITTGTDNVLVGSGAGASLTEGFQNVAIGTGALAASTSGDRSVAVGYQALNAEAGVGNNVAVGFRSMYVNTTGDENVAVGRNTLLSNTTARENTAVGYDAGQGLTTGISNTLIGHSCGEWIKTGSGNTAVGRGSLNSYDIVGSASNNVAIGEQALLNIDTGSNNVAVGKLALGTLTSAGNNTAVGTSALSLATATDNTAIGYNSGSAPAGLSANATTSGARNTFVGDETGFGTSSQLNDTVAIGRRALVSASDTVALGSEAHADHSGAIALGKSAVTTADDQLQLGARHIEVTELASDPAAPAANAARLYVKDNGSGDTRPYLRTSASTERIILAADLTDDIVIALSDETTAISTGTGVVSFRMPFAMTLTRVRASLSTASSSGVVTVDVKESGSSVLSTLLTIDANEKTSTTAATAAVISDSALADDAEITFDITGAGTNAAGLKVTLTGRRAVA